MERARMAIRDNEKSQAWEIEMGKGAFGVYGHRRDKIRVLTDQAAVLLIR